MTATLLAAGAVMVTAAAVVALQLTSLLQESSVKRRLDVMTVRDVDGLPDPDMEALQTPLRERVVTPLVHWLGRVVMRATPAQQLDDLRLSISRAGSGQRAETLLARRVLLAPLGGLGGAGLIALAHLPVPAGLVAPLLLAGLAYMYPVSALKARIRARQREVLLALPGVLDLLTISMEAGLSLDAAIMRVAEAEDSLLGREFQKALNEIRLGRPRAEALTSMAERNDVEELSSFVTAVVQAEPLGASLAQVLRIQSEELRRLRKHRAEAAGHRAPVLMLLPMMGCIFPCVFICLLGPAALTIINGH
ncbi:MAG: type II secretion system F family protein [Candidatus Dormibacteria bacterium]